MYIIPSYVRYNVIQKKLCSIWARDIVVLESEDNKDISYESEENRIKKMLFTDRAGVAKKIEKYFGIEEKKVPKESIHDYYKLVFLFYYLDIPVHVQIKPNDVRGYRLKAISDFLPEDIQTVSKMAIRGKTGYIPVEAEVMEQIDRALIRQLNLIRAARNMVMEELSDGSEN